MAEFSNMLYIGDRTKYGWYLLVKRSYQIVFFLGIIVLSFVRSSLDPPEQSNAALSEHEFDFIIMSNETQFYAWPLHCQILIQIQLIKKQWPVKNIHQSLRGVTTEHNMSPHGEFGELSFSIPPMERRLTKMHITYMRS